MGETVNTPQTVKPPVIESLAVDIEALFADPKIIKLYANSFIIGNSVTDATIVIQQGRTSIAVLTVSFTTLKSLQTALNQSIDIIEKGLGTPLLDSNNLRLAWERNMEKKSESKF